MPTPANPQMLQSQLKQSQYNNPMMGQQPIPLQNNMMNAKLQNIGNMPPSNFNMQQPSQMMQQGPRIPTKQHMMQQHNMVSQLSPQLPPSNYQISGQYGGDNSKGEDFFF